MATTRRREEKKNKQTSAKREKTQQQQEFLRVNNSPFHPFSRLNELLFLKRTPRDHTHTNDQILAIQKHLQETQLLQDPLQP